jgi:hypothetical protein
MSPEGYANLKKRHDAGHPENEPMKKCDCGCHKSKSSDSDMKKNGCDLCYWNSEYYPRHKKPKKLTPLLNSR